LDLKGKAKVRKLEIKGEDINIEVFEKIFNEKCN
jgi:hypothetical protein